MREVFADRNPELGADGSLLLSGAFDELRLSSGGT
jgi:hypothetical protein